MSTSASFVSEKMAEQNIVPEIIPVAPPEHLRVTYSSGIQVNAGDVLTPTQVKDQPIVRWIAEPDVYHTLCMACVIEARYYRPFDGELREWQHWLVGNIPGEDITKGDTLSPYIGAFPPRDTGLQPYVILLYKQPKKLNFDEQRLDDKSMSNRSGFNVVKFAKKYNLGDPIAGTFFKSKWDGYMPTLKINLNTIPKKKAGWKNWPRQDERED